MCGKEPGLLFHAFRFSQFYLSKAVYIYIVRSPRFIPSPCFILTGKKSIIDRLIDLHFSVKYVQPWPWKIIIIKNLRVIF